MFSKAIHCKSKLLWLCTLLLNFAIPTLQVDVTMVDRYGTA